MDITLFTMGWCWCRYNSDGRTEYFCDESSLTALLACMTIVVTINEFLLKFIVNRDNTASVISRLFFFPLLPVWKIELSLTLKQQ